MKFRPLLLAALTTFVLVSCHQSTDLVLNNNGFSTEYQWNVVRNVYPTTIIPYDYEEITRLQEEVKSLNKKYNSKYKYMPFWLTKFGFPDGDLKLTMYMKHPNVIIEDEEEMLNITKSTLETFSKFTGVTDKSLLRIRKSYSRALGQIWEINTENQIYEGLEVKKTRIIVKLNINGIYSIIYNWYSYIFIPDRAISENQAKESIIGMTLTEQTGYEPLITVINQVMLTKPAKKVVLPLVDDDNIVLHVAWEISVSENNSTHHLIYVDVVTNEVIEIQPLRYIN